MVLVIAIYALGQPSQKGSEAGSTTSRPTKSASKSPARSSAPRSSASSSASVSAAGAGKLPLVVLNDTTVKGLAGQAEASFKAGGWQVTSIGNLQNDIISTCAYYDPSVPGAQQGAEALMQQFPAIKRTAAKFDGLPAGPIVVVLTPDYVNG